MNNRPSKAQIIEGFVLTQQYQQGRNGIDLVFWVSTEQGAMCLKITEQESVCFFRSADQPQLERCLALFKNWRIAAVNLTDLDQHAVSALYFKDTHQQREAQRCLEDAGIGLYEPDIRPPERFLMERFVCGSLKFASEHTIYSPSPFPHFTNPPIQSSDYSPKLKLLSIDIETSFYGSDLYSIGLCGRDYRAVSSEGYEDYRHVLMRYDQDHADTANPPAWLERCDSERQLLERMIELIQRYDPDMLVGWNVINFDLQFLQKKAEQLGVKLNLGRGGGRLHLREGSGNLGFASIPGRAVVDGIDCLRGATYHFDSYSLENVSQELLGRGKKIHDVDNRAAEITDLFRNNKLELAEYNLEDCRLVLDIFDTAGLLDYLIARGHMTGLPLDKVGGSAAAFDNLYLPRLHRQGYVAPVYASGPGGLDSPGGYVMDSLPGIYDHVLVLDFKSLYPSIICTYKIDPLGLSEGLIAPEAERIPGFNHAFFHRTKHILPGLLLSLWQQRDQAKRDQNTALSQAIKIIMNSFYGVLGSNVCRFFDHRLSGSITLRGHQILTESRDFIQQQGYKVIYGDTDSVFVWAEQAPDSAAAQRLGVQLAQQLNDWWTQRLTAELGLESALEIEYETHYRRFLMPTIRGSEKGSKKRYAGLIEHAEGEDQLIFKGLESVRSDWTPLAKQFQQTLYRLVFAGDEYESYIKATVRGLFAGELDQQLMYRKRLRRPLEAYTKNQPPHVQAARKSARSRAERGLPARYERGAQVPYLITVNGPEPEDLLASKIDYEHYLERQLIPVADGVLVFLGTSMGQLLERQGQLF